MREKFSQRWTEEAEARRSCEFATVQHAALEPRMIIAPETGHARPSRLRALAALFRRRQSPEQQ
jgi:hypothetical protein